MKNFELTQTKLGTDSMRVDVEGRIAADTADTFAAVLDKLAAEDYREISVVMSKTTLLTSVGIRAILKTYKRLTETGGKFKIVSPSEPVRNVLGLSALEQMLAD